MVDIVETVTTTTKTINMETTTKEWEVVMELLRRIIWVMAMEAVINLVDLLAWTIMACNREVSTTKTTITTKGNHNRMATSSSSNKVNFSSNLLDFKAPQMTRTREVLGGHLEEEEHKTGEVTGSETIRSERCWYANYPKNNKSMYN